MPDHEEKWPNGAYRGDDRIVHEAVGPVHPAATELITQTVYPRVLCVTCGGHIGIPGSLAEHCSDDTHERVNDLWTDRDLDWYTRRYALDLRLRAERDERHRVPLLQRLRKCGIHQASDGIPSIVPPDIDDAHDAADVIDELLALCERLAADAPSVCAADRERLVELRRTVQP